MVAAEPQDIDALVRWIRAGAPSQTAPTPVCANRAHIEILADLRKVQEPARPPAGFRYLLLTPQRNSGDDAALARVRTAAGKLLNSLSWSSSIHDPPVVGRSTALRIELDRYGISPADWDHVVAGYPYGPAPGRDAEYEALRRLTNASFPAVRADWFVKIASADPAYSRLLDLPADLTQLEAKLGVAGTPERATISHSKIVNPGGSRIVERRAIPAGGRGDGQAHDVRPIAVCPPVGQEASVLRTIRTNHHIIPATYTGARLASSARAMTSRPHDKLFKSAFEAPADAAALLREVLPPGLCDVIAWRSLAADRGSFADLTRPDRHNDLLFTARLRIGAHGRAFLLLEHQSTVDPAMPQRMLSYQIRIWDRARKQRPRNRLPLVLAVLVCHVPGGWTAPRGFEDLFDPALLAIPGVAPLVPRCATITLDLAHESNAVLQAMALPPFQRLALWLLRDARDPERLLADFESWRPLLIETGRTRSEALAELIEYMFQAVDRVYWGELHAKVRTLAPGNEESDMTIAEMFKEQGRIEGRIETLRSLLLFKFHALDAATEARLQAASPADVDRYFRRLLSADSLAAVFEESARRGARPHRRRRRAPA